MPLRHTDLAPIADVSGDVYFAMVDPEDGIIPCEVARDYLIGLPQAKTVRRPSVIFEEARDDIEAAAIERYDMTGPDERGVVRLEPLIV